MSRVLYYVEVLSLLDGIEDNQADLAHLAKHWALPGWRDANATWHANAFRMHAAQRAMELSGIQTETELRNYTDTGLTMPAEWEAES